MTASRQHSPWLSHEGTLGGLRVLDLSRILSGPFCTMIMADLGADVIKVEDVAHGDDTRSWGPPFEGDDAAYFLSVNRNKRGIAVDLKDSDCYRLVHELATTADVIVENFRPGTADRLELGYERISQENPAVVYASISGFGQTGPFRQEPGYDAIAQALSGMMSVTGEADGPPVRIGVAGADLAAGMWTTIGILSALRERERTGHGRWVDVSLLDSQVSWLSYVAGGYFATGETPRRHGSAHPTIVPYQAFPTADGHIMVAAGNDELWRRFAEAVDLGHLAHDPRFATNPERVRNRDELISLIEQRLSAATADEWGGTLKQAGVPVGRINSVDEALSHPQVLARDMIERTEHSKAGALRSLATPIKLGEERRRPTAPPQHGEHTEEVASELGYEQTRLQQLRDRGAVR